MIETALDWIVNLFGLATLAIYSWALRAHFRSDGLSPQVKLLSLATTGLTIVLLASVWGYRQPAAALASGLAVMALSLGLFFWAVGATRQANLRHVFDDQQPIGIVQEGPYAYVRHPFYVAYMMFWIGWSVASWSPWSIIPTSGMALAYIMAARAEERRFEGTPYGEAYRAYAQRTGRFFPRISG